MKFFVLLLILLFGVANLKIVDCYKCNFYVNQFFGYTCEINPDPVIVEEKHHGVYTDDIVLRLDFKGNNNRHLTQSEFGQVCQRFKNLWEVKVRNAKSVDENLFQQCKNMRWIWIEDSKMEEIPENLFSSQSNLTQIWLAFNKLKTLPENIFSNQKELKRLELDNNQISCLPPNIFKSLGKLYRLSLDKNKIESLNQKWFESLQSLTHLWLDNNKIQDLPKNVFAHLRNLQYLNLDDNQLTTIHSDSFGIHRKLEKIDLEKNKINSIDEKFIDNTAVSWLKMSGNVCSNEYFNGKTNKIKAKLRNCISNYQPRVSSTIECGTRNLARGTIYGGTDINRGEFPWNVALTHRVAGLFCGGILASNRTVVTAAHCIKGKYSRDKLDPSDFTILLGVHNYTNPEEEGRVSVSVSEINIHPHWSSNVLSYDADIAVLELGNAVQFSSVIRPICLADEHSQIIKATHGVVVGFGFKENRTLPDVANKLEIPIRDYHSCIANSSDHRAFTSARTFCGGSADGTGVCDGDSGGGVYVIHNEHYYLRGIVSASLINSLNQCNVYKEAIFTDATQYYNWIKYGGRHLIPAEQKCISN